MLSFLELMERIQTFRDELMRQGFDVLLNIDQNYDSSIKIDIVIETRPVEEAATGSDIPY